MTKLDCEIVESDVGTKVVRDRTSGETMHPMGAAAEAGQVYVAPSRLEARLAEGGAPLVLYDVGLGAGSNAIAAWHVSEALFSAARRLEIVSFEHDLGALRLALEPEHAAAFGFSPAALLAANALLRNGLHESPRTTWRLAFGDFQTRLAEEPAAAADIVFWDMFSRTANPELWKASTFRAVRAACRDGATFFTYHAATSTRAGLLLAGFAVGFGEPTGKQAQTTVAALNAADLAKPLDARWLARLARSSSPFPIDVLDPSAALAAVRASGQFNT